MQERQLIFADGILTLVRWNLYIDAPLSWCGDVVYHTLAFDTSWKPFWVELEKGKKLWVCLSGCLSKIYQYWGDLAMILTAGDQKDGCKHHSTKWIISNHYAQLLVLLYPVWHIDAETKISSKFVPKVPINNVPALVKIMAWHCSGDKLLSEPMTVSLLTHICITQLQWVNISSSI